MYNYCEDWIEEALKKRLLAHKKKYPNFNYKRVMKFMEYCSPSAQRKSPEITDERLRVISKLAKNSEDAYLARKYPNTHGYLAKRNYG